MGWDGMGWDEMRWDDDGEARVVVNGREGGAGGQVEQ